QGTGNREQGTGNREQGTGNREQGTGGRVRSGLSDVWALTTWLKLARTHRFGFELSGWFLH
ncbi:MAG: hypothetical protein EYR95_12825, partial [Phormidium sp. SL48-SHIP]